ARWKVKSTIKRDGKVCEIAADTITALQDVPRRNIGTTRHVTILDVLVQPSTDGLNPRHSVLDVAELAPGEISQLVGIAVSARQRIPQQPNREIARSLRNSCDDVVIVRLRGNRDNSVVPKAIRSTLEFYANDAVPMAVVEFLRVQVLAERQRLRDDNIVAVGTKLQVKEQRGLAGNFVYEAATHTDGDIEVGNRRD